MTIEKTNYSKELTKNSFNGIYSLRPIIYDFCYVIYSYNQNNNTIYLQVQENKSQQKLHEFGGIPNRYYIQYMVNFSVIQETNKLVINNIYMFSHTKRLIVKSAVRNRGYFSTTYEMMKKSLEKNLYSIELINKQVNRRILSMAYSPGVGAVCQAIEKDPMITETTTLRARSIAIVTDGSFLNVSRDGAAPALDWIIAQIKYYSGLDAYPFLVAQDINLKQAFRDLANSYGTILYLDNKTLTQIPDDLLVLRHNDIIQLIQCQITDVEKTANVLGYLIDKKIKGLARVTQFQAGLQYDRNNFKTFVPYGHLINDGKDIYSHAMRLHQFYSGKIHIQLGFYDIQKLKKNFTQENLRKYAKQEHPYSKSSRLSAIVTDGTAVLGYGNIGPKAGLPVMEGKSLLFKLLGDVEVVPVCINPRKTAAQEVQAIIKLLGGFDAINLQDIKAPECFAIETQLNSLKKLPVFHDDQHGTAIVTLAGLINAVKVVQKDLKACKVVVNGAGAAGITIAKLLLHYGVKDIILCDSKGSIFKGRQYGMNEEKHKMAQITNLSGKVGHLSEIITGTDIFIGVSQQKALRGHWVAKMAQKSIVFALANPIPEILPQDAKKAGVWVYGSGRSDFQNQINNSLVFPGIFRALSKYRIKSINYEMKVRAAEAIAASLQGQPTRNYIIPDSLDKDVSIKIAEQLGKMSRSRAGMTH